MATKKPKVIKGDHSTRTEHHDGRIDFEIDWAKLATHVDRALANYKPEKKTKKKRSVSK